MRRALLTLVLLCAACGGEGPPADPSRAERAAPSLAAQRVRVDEVRRGHLGGLEGVSGITDAFRTASVSAEVNGRVVERHVEPSQTVAAGDPLVTLDASLLAIAVDQARATHRARNVDIAEAVHELERGEELAQRGAISDGQLDRLRFARDRARSARDLAEATLRNAERAMADTVVRAPFDGTVERIDVQVGDYLAPGTPVATVADFGRIRLRAGVTAAEAANLTIGSVATVALPALGGFSTTAEIHSVGHLADAKTGTYAVEVWLDNPELRIRSGMVAQVALPAPEGTAIVIAPRGAILRRGGRLSVYVVEEQEGRLRAFIRPVRVGREQGDFIEILEGAEPGERIVVDGLFALTDGAPVFIDEQRVRDAQGDTAWNE